MMPVFQQLRLKHQVLIGGIGSLAPSRTGDLSKLGVLALIAGTLASLLTAVIVGAIL
jgi:CNT family concentrative nucleoside transporter